MKKEIFATVLIVLLAITFLVYKKQTAEAPMDVPVEARSQEDTMAMNIIEDTPEIKSENLIFETEFTYEEVVSGEAVLINFLQTLFTVNDKDTPVSFKDLVAQDKVPSYEALHKNAQENFAEMTIFNILIKDYNPKTIDIEGKSLQVMEYIVEFTTKDNIYNEVHRIQKIHMVKEGTGLKVFSNQKDES